MSKIDIDKLFRGKFLENEKISRAYKPEHWKNFEQMLDEKMPVAKKSNYPNFLFILSSVVVIISVSFLFIYSRGLNGSPRNSQALIPSKRDFSISAKPLAVAEVNQHQDTKITSTSLHNSDHIITKNRTTKKEDVSEHMPVANNNINNTTAENINQASPVDRVSSQEQEAEIADNSTGFSSDFVKQKEVVTGENITDLTVKTKIENKAFINTDSLKKHGKFHRKKAPNPRVDFKGF